MNKDFWKGKRVFITGHTGYKGTWLAYWLTKLGADVTGYSLDPIEGALYDHLGMKLVKDIRGNICDRALLTEEIKNANPEIVFHLAAYSNIHDCIADPVNSLNTNVMGTTYLLDAISQCISVKAFVCVTSDKVYFGECELGGFKENEVTLGALEPYSASKVSKEVIIQSYRSTFLKQVGIATARASNVIGLGDPFPNRLLTNIIESFKLHREVLIRNPKAVRPWQHILDCLDGYLTLAERLYSDSETYSGAWNIGPNPDGIQDVEWIVDHMKAFWGEDASYKIVEVKDDKVPETSILRLNIEKAQNRLDWHPKWNLEDTLKQLVALEKEKMHGTAIKHLYDLTINDHYNRR